MTQMSTNYTIGPIVKCSISRPDQEDQDEYEDEEYSDEENDGLNAKFYFDEEKQNGGDKDGDAESEVTASIVLPPASSAKKTDPNQHHIRVPSVRRGSRSTRDLYCGLSTKANLGG
uniref:Uncharacterized protein n=1 Tax=Ditylenchus dipsaci TaxID=166011 RepID=A0A915DWE0_9BILA